MVAKLVVIYSGGMDSFTVLNKAVKDNYEVYALSFDYGQKHHKELVCAKQVCEELKIPHKILDIKSISSLFTSSSLVSGDMDVPDGHYEADNMKSTVVPNRNMILISLAIGYAVDIEAEGVWYGAHSGDHLIYPDCRPEFVEVMDQASKMANFEPVYVHAPYLKTDKIGILKDGLKMSLDYSNTWTCYKGLEKACGTCGSCVERLEAFEANNCSDSIAYIT
ncbi:7-cyano-7-deazaguanine synthase QueC [Psychromonas sp. MB-3u-54]|uniref:7-cyano-7-deazaguanine synthase QueC n=1 Tax=Psychromonas sp. MB-3u-54 TaxID=2058319 RepID=UPI000C347713|nr:7-cyano-7-deazaguanine synthase QueC [Psychromonas sp. MB-3u-54]PKH01429.1 7-cyano-7-deazaguanine synthase QueC [Psychromonas sp. MB-3u-54]